MRRVYLRAGLFAEGPTDYRFFGRLIPRMLEQITASLFPGLCDVEDAIQPLDAPDERAGRHEKIRAAATASAELFEILVIHADGEGDPRAKRRDLVEPGLAAIRAADPSAPLYAAACIPVRETEAWMLTDRRVFDLLGVGPDLALPHDPERGDPKVALKALVGERIGATYELFGQNVDLQTLRPLSAFQAFEAELSQAVRAFVADQGHRSVY